MVGIPQYADTYTSKDTETTEIDIKNNILRDLSKSPLEEYSQDAASNMKCFDTQ